MSSNDGPQGPGAAVHPRDIRVVLPDSGRLPRVGKLRLGIKKEGSSSGRAVSFPSAVDYFVVNEDMSTSRQAAESFHDIYGPEPKQLDVTLPAAAIADVLEGAWRSYGTGGLLKRRCEGPGGTCVSRDSLGSWVSAPCLCAAEGLDPSDKKRHCAERYTLTVMLMRVQGVGVWQLDTGSRMAAEGLTSSLRMIESFRGHLQGAQATLRVVPRQVSPGGVAKTVYIAELGSSDITPQQALAIAENPVRVQLPPSTLDEGPDDLLDADVIEPPNSNDIHLAAGEGRPIAAAAEPVKTVGVQIKALSAMQRGELYRLAGIPRGTSSPDVRALLCAAWDAVNLPPFRLEPDVAVLLTALLEDERTKGHSTTGVEAFQTFADTGVEIEPGDQTSMYGGGAPS